MSYDADEDADDLQHPCGVLGYYLRARGCCRILNTKYTSRWWKTSQAKAQRNDMLAKACSVVLWGWQKGKPVPIEALAALSARVETPAATQQAKEVFALYQAKQQLQAALDKWDRLQGRGGSELRERIGNLHKRVRELLDQHRDDGSSKLSMHSSSKWRIARAKLTSKAGMLLPMCFITFRNSEAAKKALASTQLADELEKLGVHIGPAPRPTDVKWIHLHQNMTGRKAARLALYDLLTLLICVPLIVLAILAATAFAQMCLFWVPMNAYVFTPNSSAGLLAEKWIGGFHWVWGIFMFASVYGVLHQLIALPLGDGGLWPENYVPRLKDWYHSRTLGQFRFVKVVASIEMVATLTATVIIFPWPWNTAREDWQPISKRLCDMTCLCWWSNPYIYPQNEEDGSWYDFGAGLGVNPTVNSFIGDAVLTSLALPLLGGWIQQQLAKRQPTQHLMDQAVRTRDQHYLPVRIVHLVKVWTFHLLLMPLVPFIAVPTLAYYLLSVLVDRIRMLRLLEPPPPTAGLCMRFVVQIMMPAVLPLHIAIGTIGYVALYRVKGPDGTNSSSDLLPIAEALSDPRIIAYLAFGLTLLAAVLYNMFVRQRAIALRRKLMTPWQVFLAAFKSDEGFAISSTVEPLRYMEGSLDHMKNDEVRSLYTPPFLHKSAGDRTDSDSFNNTFACSNRALIKRVLADSARASIDSARASIGEEEAGPASDEGLREGSDCMSPQTLRRSPMHEIRVVTPGPAPVRAYCASSDEAMDDGESVVCV